MARIVTRIARVLRVPWSSSNPANTSVSSRAHDEEALNTSTTSVQSSRRRNLCYRATVFVLVYIPVAVIGSIAFCASGILFGAAVAMLRFVMILPILVPVAFASGTMLSPSYESPDRLYIFRFLLQFLQAGIVGICTFFAVAMFALGVMQAWKVMQWTPHQACTTSAPQADTATDAKDKDWKSTLKEICTTVVEQASSSWFLAPFAYAGAHALRYLCGGGWDLLLPDGGSGWPVWLVLIGEGLVRLVVLCRTYERNYRIVRERLELERSNDPSAVESIKLDSVGVDVSKV